MNAKLQKQLEGLSERVERLQKNFGVVAKATGVNDPPVPSIDGQRSLIAELLAESVARANADVRAAMLRSPLFLALMREAEKNPMVVRVLIESILEAERVDSRPATMQDKPLVAISVNYAPDARAFEVAQERERQLDAAREIIKKPVRDIQGYRIAKGTATQVFAAAQAIADNLARGGKDASAADVAKMIEGTKREPEPMVDYSLQKSASDKTPVDVRDLGRPRRMHPSEILR